VLLCEGLRFLRELEAFEGSSGLGLLDRDVVSYYGQQAAHRYLRAGRGTLAQGPALGAHDLEDGLGRLQLAQGLPGRDGRAVLGQPADEHRGIVVDVLAGDENPHGRALLGGARQLLRQGRKCSPDGQ